jgi:NAD(P)-dependent dehydrogenase (short-subunit alcohol dehydrogenase family)
LDGRVAVVTGASRGIGRATAVELAAAGADVALIGRQAAALQSVSSQIERDCGKRALAVELDVSNTLCMSSAIERIVEAFDGIDVLVNNAGLIIRRASSAECSTEDWDAIFGTNLRGTFFLTKEVARVMAGRGRGKIISLGSVAGLVGLPGVAAYGASKAALQHLTRVLAVEWAPHNIQVNAVAPGWVATGMTDALRTDPRFHSRYEWILDRTPQRRFAEPVEIARVIVFLASAASDFITGQVLAVDGGLTAGSDWR